MKDPITESYKKNGALLTLRPLDAFILEEAGLGELDAIGNSGEHLGFHVPGSKVDTVRSGDEPILSLVGGWKISRGEPDILSHREEIDTSVVF